MHDVAAGMGGGKPFHVVAGVRAPHNPMTPAPWCPSPSVAALTLSLLTPTMSVLCRRGLHPGSAGAAHPGIQPFGSRSRPFHCRGAPALRSGRGAAGQAVQRSMAHFAVGGRSGGRCGGRAGEHRPREEHLYGPRHLFPSCAFLPCSLADEIALRRHLLQQRSVRDTPRQLPLVCAFPDSSACWQWVPPWALPHRAGQAAPLRLRYPRPSL